MKYNRWTNGSFCHNMRRKKQNKKKRLTRLKKPQPNLTAETQISQECDDNEINCSTAHQRSSISSKSDGTKRKNIAHNRNTKRFSARIKQRHSRTTTAFPSRTSVPSNHATYTISTRKTKTKLHIRKRRELGSPKINLKALTYVP